MKNNKIILYPHGGSGNRGCEAIVRSTAKILKDYSMSLYSSNPEEDRLVGINDICTLKNINDNISVKTRGYFISLIKYYSGIDKIAFDKLSFSPIINDAKKETIALSIGGDVYCYSSPKHLYLINREIRKKGVKNILWGCSINEESIDDEMLDDLLGFDHILVRESLTYNILKQKGVKKISLCPDPAFLLNKNENIDLPSSFIKYNTVGINISPLIQSFEKEKDITLKSYQQLIEYILDNTDMNIALIPHVIWKNNDDKRPLTELSEIFRANERVFMIPDYPAEDIKGVISMCRFLVTARTHASIAAYSECIPTLVIGYSVKAKGIAKDIFGGWENYVIPVQDLNYPKKIIDAFKYIVSEEKNIKNHLQQMMP